MDLSFNVKQDCPLVSIIVPVYNVSKYLSRCIESVILQSYSNYECLLIDDGSNEDSGALCDYYTCLDSRFTVIHKKNGGVSDARNTGIDLANGQYIVFCDSDDCVHVHYLEELIKCKNDYINDFVVCGYNKVFNGSEKKRFIYENSKYSSLRISDYMLLFDKELIQTPYCKLFSSDVIKNQNIRFDIQLSLGEDIVFILNYLGAAKIQAITVSNLALYEYYQNGDNALSVKFRPDLLDIYEKIYCKIFGYLNAWGADKRNIESFYDQRFSHYIIAFHNFMRNENKDSIFKKYRKINSVIKSKSFRKALSFRKEKMNHLIYFAYRCGNYWLVCALERIARIKNKCMH